MLTRFGSLSALVAASPREIAATANEGERWVEPFLGMLGLFRAALDETVERSPLDPADANLHAWLRAEFLGLKEERMIGLFGDGEGRFIARELLAVGNSSELVASPRGIFGRAFTLGASMLILAHNHPSGRAQPSRADIAATDHLQVLGRSLGVAVVEHFVVGAGGIFGIIKGSKA